MINLSAIQYRSYFSICSLNNIYSCSKLCKGVAWCCCNCTDACLQIKACLKYDLICLRWLRKVTSTFLTCNCMVSFVFVKSDYQILYLSHLFLFFFKTISIPSNLKSKGPSSNNILCKANVKPNISDSLKDTVRAQRRWPVTYLIRISPNVSAFLSRPPQHSCIKSCWGWSPALMKLHVFCVQPCVCVYTLTNTALGFIVVDITNITQAIVAALLILTPCCSTHAWVLTLIHIWKIRTGTNSVNTKSSPQLKGDAFAH